MEWVHLVKKKKEKKKRHPHSLHLLNKASVASVSFSSSWISESRTSTYELVKLFFLVFDAIFMNGHFLTHEAENVALYGIIWVSIMLSLMHKH